MKFITISQRYFDICGDDPEILFRKNRRPHLLVLSLKYKGQVSHFAVPLRSNISAATPKDQYFSLPPRPSTRPGNHHGLHYIKMFPITREYQEKFWVGKDAAYILYQNIINKHEKEIVAECQKYLDAYANGLRLKYSVNIDQVFERLNANQQNTNRNWLGRGTGMVLVSLFFDDGFWKEKLLYEWKKSTAPISTWLTMLSLETIIKMWKPRRLPQHLN